MLPVVLASVMLAAPAQAKKPKVFTRIPAEEIATLARNLGHQVEQTTDNVGDPLLNIKSSDLSYQVVFYGCSDDGCDSLQFRAWWKADKAWDVEKLNEFNKSIRQGRGYLDRDRDPTFELLVELDGGVTMAHLDHQLGQFIEVSEIFVSKVIEAK